MAASPKLIARYAETYISTFPTSTIILITSSVGSFIYTSESEWRRQLAPAIDVLLGQDDRGDADTDITTGKTRGQVVGIAYSNGGAQSLIQIGLAYRSRTLTPLPLSSTILDSAPGSPEITVSHRAMLLSLPIPKTPVIRLPASLLLWLYLAITWLYMGVMGVENPIDGVRDRINDTTLFRPGKRVYVYSREDEMVPWEWVEANAGLAEKRGWSVQKERFEGSKHVAHAIVDKERYWSIIKKAVET